MNAEIVLMNKNRTIHFETNEPICAPDILYTEDEVYQLVNFGFRPIGSGAFIWSVVYKPASYLHLSIPPNARIIENKQS